MKPDLQDIETSNKIVMFGEELRNEYIRIIHSLMERVLYFDGHIESVEEYRGNTKEWVQDIIDGKSPQLIIDELVAKVTGLEMWNEDHKSEEETF